MSIAIEPVTAPTDDARRLVGELDAELNSTYEPRQRHGLEIASLFRPNIVFVIARLEGRAVGCGGVALDEEWAELKRMYVTPGARGGDVARSILAHLEQQARSRGITRLVLETGDAQRRAMRFYEREGFTRCGPFGAYAAMAPASIDRSVFYEKRLG